MIPMLMEFIAEARDLLQAAAQTCLELEQRPGDTKLVNRLFRAVHTIKGASGLFDIAPLTAVVHAAEDFLDSVRSGEMELGPAMADLVLECLDQLGAWIDELEDSESLSPGAAGISQDLACRFRALVRSVPEAEAEDDTEGKLKIPPPSVQPPAWLTSKLSNQVRRDLYNYLTSRNAGFWAVTYTPDERCFFGGDDPLHTLSQVDGILWHEIENVAEWPDAEELDPFACNINLRLLTESAPQALAELFQYVPDEVELTLLPASALVRPEGKPGDLGMLEAFVSEARRHISGFDWAGLLASLPPALDITGHELLEGSALRWLASVLKTPLPDAKLVDCLVETVASGRWPNQGQVIEDATGGGFACAEQEAGHLETGPDQGLRETARKVLSGQQELLNAPCQEEGWPGRLASVVVVLGHVFKALNRPLLLQRTQEAAASEYAAQSKGKILAVLGDAVRQLEDKVEVRVEPDLRATALDILDAQLAVLEGGAEDEEPLAGRLPAAAAVLRNAFGMLGFGELASMVPQALDQGLAEGSHQPLYVLAQAGIEALGNTGGQEACGTVGKSEPDDKPQATKEKPKSKFLKVDLSRIDNLIDLAGELVVAKNALPFLSKRAAEVYGVEELSRDINNQYAVVNRISEDLQAAVMAVRMMAVSHAFQRFPRLVRDLARKQGKQISLKMEGEDTEADKNIVEELADPLIHLVRNSIDHAIETPDEREAAGKSPEACIILRTYQQGDLVVIEVIDDGRGIDPAKIKRKAVEKGILPAEKLDALSDQDAIQLIFAAGFSTAETISDISGRGVGMDVVRSMVAATGGSVNVESELGKGTTVRMALPLSMAVTHILMIEVAGQSYGVPMDRVLETVLLAARDIHRVKNKEVTNLRGRILPVYRVRRCLGLETGGPGMRSREEEYLLVVVINGEEAGLIVDKFHEGLDVILKPLDGVMAGFKAYAGSALLGDGRVLLVLNLEELV